jgi:hypothetical protein
MLEALMIFFALMALFGYVLTPLGQERISAAIGFFVAPRDPRRATTRHHQMAIARTGGSGRRAFGKR